MNRIERYLASVVITHTLLVLLVLTALTSFSTFMAELDDINERYQLTTAALYTLLKVPNTLYQMFPVAILIGTLMGLGSLANQSELTVLRATGWSVRRIFFAVVKTAFMFWLAVALMGEYLGAPADNFANKVRVEALEKSFTMGKNNGFWVNNGGRYIFIQHAVASDELRNLSVYSIKDGQLDLVQQVPKAVYLDDEWIGYESESRQLDWKSKSALGETWLNVEQTASAEEVMDLPFIPDDLGKLNVDAKTMNAWDLHNQIAFLKQSGVDSGALELAFWSKIASPLTILAMVAIVFPLIFGSQRQVSMGQRIFFGVLIGLMFHLVNQLVGNLSVVYQLPVVMAAFVPGLILLSVALVWLRWQK